MHLGVGGDIGVALREELRNRFRLPKTKGFKEMKMVSSFLVAIGQNDISSDTKVEPFRLPPSHHFRDATR